MVRTLALCGFAVALVGMLTLEAVAQSSCNGEYATCRSRCGQAACPYCDSQLASCRRTGCWQHTPKWGGQRLCNLRKS